MHNTVLYQDDDPEHPLKILYVFLLTDAHSIFNICIKESNIQMLISDTPIETR